jgi:hypothetical protein
MSDEQAYGEVFHAEYAAAQRRFMRGFREWADLAPTEQASIRAGAIAVAGEVRRRTLEAEPAQPAVTAVDMLGVAVNELEEIAAAPDLRTAQITAAGALDIIRNRFTGDGEWKLVSRAQPGPEQPQGGQWERIAFMGHIEYTGRVTRFDRYGEPAYRIELPDLVFGGNPLAYREHRASMWFSSEPVSEESARAAWKAQQERAAQQAREEAEWHARQQQRALEAANDDDESQGEAF